MPVSESDYRLNSGDDANQVRELPDALKRDSEVDPGYHGGTIE